MNFFSLLSTWPNHFNLELFISPSMEGFPYNSYNSSLYPASHKDHVTHDYVVFSIRSEYGNFKIQENTVLVSLKRNAWEEDILKVQLVPTCVCALERNFWRVHIFTLSSKLNARKEKWSGNTWERTVRSGKRRREGHKYWRSVMATGASTAPYARQSISFINCVL